MRCTNELAELKKQHKQIRTIDKMIRRFTLLTFYCVTKHPLPFTCPPRLPSIPPSLPSFPLSQSYKSPRSFIRPVSGLKRPPALKEEGWRPERRAKRQKQKRRDEREGTASFKALFPSFQNATHQFPC